jgi:uncharacterized protein YndB with AHSA1/START domain
MVDIYNRVGVNAAPETVYAALATIDGLNDWFMSGVTGDASKGGDIDLGVFGMEVLYAEPYKLVRWKCVRGPDQWVGTELSFQLLCRDGQTYVLFKQSGWREASEFLHHSSTKWATLLLSLRDAVESSEGRPIPRDLKIYFNEGRGRPLPF